MRNRPISHLAVPVVIAFCLASCGRNKTPDYRLGQLAPAPDWAALQVYQHTISRDAFVRLLEDIYSEGNAWQDTIKIHADHAAIRKSTAGGSSGQELFRLFFSETSPPIPPPRYWRTAGELPPANDLGQRPLEGLRIAIDPGHIGGQWAQTEERWYQIDGGTPVREGDMALSVARLLRPRLEALGALVTLVREDSEPVTTSRPGDFTPEAHRHLLAMGVDPGDPASAPTPGLTVRRHSEKLFYRTSEIRARAEKINRDIRPDLVLCLHFNAEPWGNPEIPELVTANHLHLLINGTYSRGELRLDDQRYEMLIRLLQRTHRSELAISRTVSAALSAASGLPPFVYPGTNAKRVDDNPYTFARNLIANRLYRCPVIFLEPYVMNNAGVYARVQAGDYDGEKRVNGILQKSLFREYADAVTDGLRLYYQGAKNPSP